MQIRPENTAITNGTAKSALMIDIWLPEGAHVLDYGAGKLRNANYLVERGYQVSIVDTAEQLRRLPSKSLTCFKKVYDNQHLPFELFDGILCSFVMNVIEDKTERENVLCYLESVLKPGGTLILEVRREKGIEKNKHKEEYRDGYLVGKNSIRTFQKGYSEEDVWNLFKVSNLTVLKVQKLSDSYVVVAQKEETPLH